MWFKDPKTGKKSATLTFFIIAFAVAIVKILLADLTIKGFAFGSFSGTDFATVIAAVGGVYGFRKFTDKDKDTD